MDGEAASTWEDRMAARAAERAARRKVEEPPEAPAPGHEGHHGHIQGNGVMCSCGACFGCFSFAPDPRYWSDDLAEREQAAREDADFEAWISCRICGQRGVVYEGDFGVWPPRRMEETSPAGTAPDPGVSA